MLSVVLPVFNESRCNYLDKILDNLARLPEAEIIIVDGGSSDDTLARIGCHDFNLITLPDSSRACRLNAGMETSSGNLVFLHHPRTLVSWQVLEQLENRLADWLPCWGGLSHQFDWQHPLLRFTSWYSNRVRFDSRGIVYLDHCLFLDRTLVDQGFRFPDVPIFEDTEFSRLLRKTGKPVRLADSCTTSAIRFRSNGIYRQALLNQFLKIAYWFNTPASAMNRYYERGLDLNE